MKKPRDNGWTQEEIDSLLEMLPTHSNRQIALKMTNRTRSAVSGKINRLKAQGALPPQLAKHYDITPNRRPNHPPSARSNATPMPKKPKPKSDVTVAVLTSTVIVVASDTPLAPCTLLDLDHTRCRWPLWTDYNTPAPDKFYCGEPPLAGLPYCRKHCETAFTSGKVPTYA